VRHDREAVGGFRSAHDFQCGGRWSVLAVANWVREAPGAGIEAGMSLDLPAGFLSFIFSGLAFGFASGSLLAVLSAGVAWARRLTEAAAIDT